ncbi:MAG: CFI-box-CTERM domain-containing protein [Oscillospiraceae bacterium]
MEDSRLIPGICPQCGGRLQIPAELRHFSCLYCGARLDLAELLPEPSQTERVPAAEAQEAYDFAAAHLPECVTAYPRALRHLTKGEFEPYFQEYRTACRPVCQRIPAAAQAMPQQGSEAALTALSDGFLTQLEAWLVRHKKGRSGRDALLDDMKFTICLFLIPCIRLENSPACEDFCRILQEQWLERYPAKPFRLTTYPDILQGFQRRKLCFITTAACSRLGKPDDGPELTAFRSFRDGYLQAQPDGPQLIAQYYDWAPELQWPSSWRTTRPRSIRPSGTGISLPAMPPCSGETRQPARLCTPKWSGSWPQNIWPYRQIRKTQRNGKCLYVSKKTSGQIVLMRKSAAPGFPGGCAFSRTDAGRFRCSFPGIAKQTACPWAGTGRLLEIVRLSFLAVSIGLNLFGVHGGDGLRQLVNGVKA